MELRETLEIRKLSPKYRAKLVSILQNQDDWKMLMCNIPEVLPKDCFNCTIGENNLPRYNSDHIRIIEQASNDYNRPAVDVLFEEWGSSGRVRPNLGHLFHLAQKLEMFQAAEYIASLLNKSFPKRPAVGPSAAVELNEDELKLIEGHTNISSAARDSNISSALRDMGYPSNLTENPEPRAETSVNNVDLENNMPDISDLMRTTQSEMSAVVDRSEEGSLTADTDSNRTNNNNSNNYTPNFDLIDTDEESAIIPNQEYTMLRNLCLEGTIIDPFPGVRRDKTDSAPGKSLALNTPLRHFTYSDLRTATNNFDKTPVAAALGSGETGRFLGSGGYGSVYLALGLKDEPTAAVKKIALDGQMLNLQDHILNSFKTEVENLYKFKHENLVALLGYSCDGPSICLVYEYIPGGNLKNLISDVGEQLQWRTRIEVALGICNAVCYLHIANPKQPFIHRDIKTANILLDAQKKPKLCDFGTARLSKHTTSHTINVIGTGPYMSPEGTRGDVSVKLDTFSFGVVLLELLTGWPPLDHSRSSYDLLTYVREFLKDSNENVIEILDRKAGDWMHNNVNFGLELYKICKKCVEDLKTDRPFMMNVKDRLQILVDMIHGNCVIVPHVGYDALKNATNNFDESRLIKDDEKVILGTDTFGLEYLAVGLFQNAAVVKRMTMEGHSSLYYDFHLHSFKAEVEKIHGLKHENLVSLLGYCCEYPHYCVIYEFVDGDNLQNKLKNSQNVLSCMDRFEIATKISRAISYLHTIVPDKPMVHRDLKSINVLLNENNHPKLRIGRIFKHTSTHTLSVSKADPYISPEGVRGDISVKLDTFSFGIVLLELLTGLKPLDPERSSFDLLTYVGDRMAESNDITSLLDIKVDSWIISDTNVGEKLYQISELCVKEKPKRPTMVDVNKQLEDLLDNLQPRDDFRPALSFLMDTS